jgi:hypothetical protein
MRLRDIGDGAELGSICGVELVGSNAKKYMLADDRMYDKFREGFGGPAPGIYRLHQLDGTGSFRPLARLLDSDEFGTLYIGTSWFVPNRANKMRGSICAAYRKLSPNTYGHLTNKSADAHQTGKAIKLMPLFAERLPLDHLCVTGERFSNARAPTDADHVHMEARLLREYAERFGEWPPLNGLNSHTAKGEESVVEVGSDK